MEFIIGAVFGALLAGTVAWVILRRLARAVAEGIPLESLLTFIAFDAQGNQLTERALVSLGADGSNPLPIITTIMRAGTIHHGVLFIGEYGALIQMGGDDQVNAGDTYVIPQGAWSTELTQFDKPSE